MSVCRTAKVHVVDCEVFDRQALDYAIDTATGTFTMIEAGAGYGRWVVRAWELLRSRRPELTAKFVAIEAEPTHFKHMQDYIGEHGIELSSVRLINAAVNAKGGRVHFTVGHADEWYGQAITPPDSQFGDWPNARLVEIDAVAFSEVIADIERIDLLAMDIQGAEQEIIECCMPEITRKVRVINVGTHSDVGHEAISRMLRKWRWTPVATYSPLRTHDTPLGSIEFQDGVHVWLAPSVRRLRFGSLRFRLREMFSAFKH